jgi:hypothetical protein
VAGEFPFWPWLARALWQRREVIDRSILAATVVVSVVAFLVSNDVATQPVMPWFISASVIAVGLLISFATRAYQLEKAMAPNLHFGEVEFDQEERAFFIRVHNCGLAKVDGILVRLERLLDRTGRQLKSYIALSTRYHPNVPKTSRFSLDPRSSKEVMICKLRPNDGLFEIVHFEEDKKDRWILGDEFYFLELTINSIGEPISLTIAAQLSDPPRLIKHKRPNAKIKNTSGR